MYTSADAEVLPAREDVVLDMNDEDEHDTQKGTGTLSSTTPGKLPPETSFDYKISDQAFRAARAASPGSAESYWTYALYRHVEDGSRVKVHYCRSREATERVCQQYFAHEPLLGFDLEWMPNASRWDSVRNNVSVMQLASPSRIGIFHFALYPRSESWGSLSDFSSLMTPTVRQILEDENIIKTGVYIQGDAKRLSNFFHVGVRGMLELSHLHNLVKYSQTGEFKRINRKLVSLAVQVQETLGLPLFKGMDVRAGDWSRRLSMDQILYSASDAYAAIQIFDVLERQRKSLVPLPPRPAFAELRQPIRLADLSAALPADASPPGRSENAKTIKTAMTLVEPRDSRVLAADVWQARYRAQHAPNRTVEARPSWLRAYHLWHNDEALPPTAVAALLRSPPLKTETVANYVLEAVLLEHLPYDKMRLRTELLDQMSPGVIMKRFQSLAAASGWMADQ